MGSPDNDRWDSWHLGGYCDVDDEDILGPPGIVVGNSSASRYSPKDRWGRWDKNDSPNTHKIIAEDPDDLVVPGPEDQVSK